MTKEDEVLKNVCTELYELDLGEDSDDGLLIFISKKVRVGSGHNRMSSIGMAGRLEAIEEAIANAINNDPNYELVDTLIRGVISTAKGEQKIMELFNAVKKDLV